MLIPQDIQKKEFSKAVFGGYDMAAVDDFLEEVAGNYAAIYKENVTLKQKLKVLVEKVEEYRSTEDAMRMALLTAQKMSDEMTEETKKKCEAILHEAELAADRKRADIDRELSDEQMRLEAAKARTASFVSAARQISDQYMQFLDKLGEVTKDYGGAPVEAPVAENDQVRSPEPEPALKTEIVLQKLAPRPAQPAEPAQPEPAPAPAPAPAPEQPLANSEPLPEDLSAETRRFDTEAVRRAGSPPRVGRRIVDDDDDYDDEEDSPQAKSRYSNLKFGTNYNDD